MIFVWVILAVITSQIQEWVASMLAWRASMLEDTVVNMLGDPELTKKFYNHPLIKGLWTNNGKRKPGGIPEDKFALVLFEHLISADQSTAEIKDTFDRLKQNVINLKASENHELHNFATSLDTLMIGIEHKTDDAAQAITEARQRVEGWFNNSMDRLGGAYKRRVQIVALIAGVTIAAVLNVDTVQIATALWKDPVLRQAVVTQANAEASQSAAQAQPSTPPTVDEIVKNMDKLNTLTLPVGWSPKNMPTNTIGWVSKIMGILLSGMAGAQGAPYWFDLMRKLLSRG
jgi:hypothetical protein